jgi:hypothetical protein
MFSMMPAEFLVRKGVTYAKNDAKNYVGPIRAVCRRDGDRIAVVRFECGW